MKRFSKETMKRHRMTWYITETPSGSWGYDAVCSCGWETPTGGGTRTLIEGAIRMHRREAESGLLD